MKKLTTLAMAILALVTITGTAHADKEMRDLTYGRIAKVTPVSELCQHLRVWNAKTAWEDDTLIIDGKTLVADLVVLMGSHGEERNEICVISGGTDTVNFGSTSSIVPRVLRILEASKKNLADIEGASGAENWRQAILEDLIARLKAAIITKNAAAKDQVLREVVEFGFTAADLPAELGSGKPKKK